MPDKLTPTQTVKAHCQECLGLNQFNRAEIENCQGDTCFTGPCPSFPYRLGKRAPVKVFRQFCIHCIGGQAHLVPDCLSIGCKCHPYRMGKNPALIGKRRLPDTLKVYNQNARDVAKYRQESTNNDILIQGASL